VSARCERRDRPWPEIDLRASVDECGRKVIVNRQDQVPESVVNAELDRAPKMLACPARKLPLDA
jgi:hypothetical protein